MSRRLAALCLSIGVLGGAAVAAWWWQASPAPQDDAVADLPLPPFPPRITEGKDYESCLAALADDPAGAAALEHLGATSVAPPMARALVLGQAGQARLMIAQPDKALADASLALTLSSADTDLFIMRATAEGLLDRFRDAVTDLSDALQLDASRADTLVSRAVMHRQLNELDLAQADVARVLAKD